MTSTAQPTPQVKHLRDYRPPTHLVDRVALRVDIRPEHTTVAADLVVRRNPAGPEGPLVLDGRELELLELCLDGRPLAAHDYQRDAQHLTLAAVPETCELHIVTRIRPQDNTSLVGLYLAGGTYLTQCEAEGFRKITYFPDRPDVMARYRCTIEADRTACPVLLANGNPVAHGERPDGRHYAVWEDPYPKPSYLFALVAGDLAECRDTFVTRSGRAVELRFFVDPGDEDKCRHAIASLKKAMRWDEETFGLEYDLDRYMIVATHAFNAGAMENKGLNIFNSRYVLADTRSATDNDFANIENVIAHEYFHNWTGNRITLNSWFQLSLKEGLTVFRDQEFSSDAGSRAIKRIADVKYLRAVQFAEDAGPMAHPVRPESYLEIDNFYTATVYHKGAEVIRMLHTLLGAEGFRRGMDRYVQRFDGQAAATDDFVQAMADAGGIDLGVMRRWYTQAGTPRLAVRRRVDADRRTCTLTFSQTVPATPGQSVKKPHHIPIRLALLDADGNDLPLTLAGDEDPGPPERVVSLTTERTAVTFHDLPATPVPSLLRGFSAPVIVDSDLSHAERLFLLAHDRDPFNRWDAAQELLVREVLRLTADWRAGRPLAADSALLDACRRTLTDTSLDRALVAWIITLPSETELGDRMTVVDVDGVHAAREFLADSLAEALGDEFLAVFTALRDTGPYRWDPPAAGRRRLKHRCLAFLARRADPSAAARVMDEFTAADNMTDEVAALTILADLDGPHRQTALERFYHKWQGDTLVLDKWFAIQAGARGPGTLARVEALMDHPRFSLTNPNKVRSLVGVFCRANPWNFHQAGGAGYRFLADAVLALDPLNPSVAARLAGAFNKWKRYDEARRQMMQIELERIRAVPSLSPGVTEIVSKTLAP